MLIYKSGVFKLRARSHKLLVHDTLLNLHAICIESLALEQARCFLLIRLLILEVRAVVEIKISDLWAVVQFILVDGYKHFRGESFLLSQSERQKHVPSKRRSHVPTYTTQQTRKH